MNVHIYCLGLARDHSYTYYVSTFLGFLDPPPPLRKHIFNTKNKQKLAFSDPLLPTIAYVICI